MTNITLIHGSNRVTTAVDNYTSVSEAISSLAAVLRLPDSYSITDQDGDPVNGSDQVSDGSIYTIEKLAAKKG